jgi:hypothetical protein
MSDSLRDRIAAIIDREVDGLWEPLEVADAVIAEIGLKHYCRDCGGYGPFDE